MFMVRYMVRYMVSVIVHIIQRDVTVSCVKTITMMCHGSLHDKMNSTNVKV